MSNRRCCGRARINSLIRATYVTPSIQGVSLLSDVSAHGLKLSHVTASCAPQVGEEIRITIHLNGAPFEVRGRVANRQGLTVGIQVLPDCRVRQRALVRALVGLAPSVDVGLVEQCDDRTLRVKGALTGTLSSDLVYLLKTLPVRWLDLSEVERLDLPGLGLCLMARDKFYVQLVNVNQVIRDHMRQAGVGEAYLSDTIAVEQEGSLEAAY